MLLNRNRFVRAASCVAMSLFAAVGWSQVQVVDGIADYQYQVPIVTQNVDTGFGNNLSELDVAWSYIKDGKLYLTLAGNLEGIGNKLNIFVDSVSGGQNRLRGDNLNGGGSWYLTRLGDSGGPNGLLFETGFEADYFFGLNLISSTLYVDYSNLPTSSGGSGSYLGAANPLDGVLSGGTNPNSVKANINNSNTAGVSGGTAAGYAKGGVVTTGIELEIPLAAIGNPTGTVRIVAFVGNTDNSSLSNQFLPGVGYNGGPVGNYGEPRGVNLGGTTGSNVGTHYFIAPWVGNGNLAVLQVNGTSGAANSVSIKEFTPSGTLVTTHDFSAGTSGVTLSGSATTEGQLQLSSSGQEVVFLGYAQALGGAIPTTNHTIASLNRSGQQDVDGNFAASSNTGRAAFQFESNWAYGAGSSVLRYLNSTSGSITPASVISQNNRIVLAYNNQLYAGTSTAINAIGAGLPNTTATSSSLLTGLTELHDFYFADALTIYLTSSSGVRKATYASGIWTVGLAIAGTSNCRSITGTKDSSGRNVIYFTTSTGDVKQLVDDSTPVVTTVATVASGAVFRGVDLSPVMVAANQAPVLDPIGGQSGDEETLITFDANATDPDSGQTLTYSLVGAPAGASIDSSTGVFTFTPTEAQGPGSFTFDVVVTDNGTSPLSDTETITVTVNEANVAPILSPIGAQSGDENTLITFDANASDADLPANTLTFSLSGAPAGASIDPGTGVFTWTPTEAQSGPATFDVVVSDGTLTDTETITVTVNEVNEPPTADPQNVNVGYNTPQAITLTGSDTDIPAQTLSFSVVAGPANGNLSGTAPNLTYTPNVNYSGADSFTFKVNDGTDDSTVETVSITVAAGAPMTVETFGSPAPNGFGSPSFAGYVTNALNSLENSLGDIGDRTVTPTAYEQETQITWRDITVASFPLWLGQLNPAAPFDQEYGNRLHFGVRILGNGTLFSLEMLEFDMDSSDPNNDLDFDGDFVGFNYSSTRFGINYGPDRVKGGGDDVTYTSGNGTTLVDEIVYVGIGNAWWAQGAGTEAEQLMEARCYIESLAPITVMTTYQINDGVNILGSGSATVTVMPTNVLPTAQDQNVSTPINTPANITLVATDPDNEPLDYTVVVGPTNGNLSGTAPNLIYTPNTNFVGVDTFTFKAADCVGDSNVATVTITVQAPDPVEMRIVGTPAPNAFGSPNWEAYLSNAITSLKDELGSTGDRTLDPAGYQEVTQIPWKDIVVSGFNSWRGVAAPGAPFHAEYGNRLHFGVRIQGNGRRIKLSDVEVTMTSSDPNNDLGFTQDWGALSIPYSTRRTGLDYGPDRDRGTLDDFMVTSGPGTTEVDELIFIGLGNAWDATFESGTDQEKLEAVRCYIEPLAPIDVTSEYRLKDGLGGYLVTGSATVTVVPTNVLPTANNQSVSTDEDTPVNITLTATDPDNEPLDYAVVAEPTNGYLSGTAPNLIYTPNPDFAGVDTFTFKATDCVGDSNVATITITVDPVNDAPTIEPVSPPTVDELTLATFTATANDPDAGEMLTFTLVGAPAGASIHPTSGVFNWTPTEAQGPGSFTFDVVVTDSGTLSASTSVTITVNEVNVAPVADDQNVTTDEDQPVNITLTGSDSDLPANTLSYSVVAGPTNGMLSGTAPNLTYTPNANFNGADSFTFKINDGTEDSNIATVSITVDAVNDAPTAQDDNYNTAEDTLLDVDAPGVLGNDSDLDVGLTAILVTGPSFGTLNLNSDGSFEYTPQANFNGVDTFTYKANDGQEDSNVATVTITVTPVNDIVVEQFVSAAPNFYGSPSYDAWETNAMNSLENGLGNIGNRATDPTAYEQLGAITQWGDGVVSGFISWRGEASPPVPFQAELGNRLHFGVRILGNGTRFKLKNLYNDMNSSDIVNTFDFDGDFVGYPYRPWRKGIDYGPDRVKGGGDDIVYSNGESEDLEVDELIYSGVGNAFDATFGSGTDQEKLNEVRCYISDNQPLIVDNRYEIRDDLGDPMASSTVSVILDPENGVPVANDQNVTTDEDTPVNITLTATDPDTDPLTWEIVTGPTFGTLSGTAPNLTYTPNANYAGADSFTFRVNDGICDSNIATVSITVTPVNDVQVQVYGASAPNFFGSPSFGGYRDNALNGLENGLLVVGDRNADPTGYEALTSTTWRDIVVAGFPLWRGTINPSAPFDAEYGNRMHFGLRILGNGTRFKLSNLKFDMNSSDPDNSMDFDGDFVGGAYSASRKGIDYGPDRQKGGGDDVVYTNGESGDLEIDEFIYVGVGNAFDATPQGGNTPEEELLLTRCYIENVAPMDVSVAYTICDDLNQPIATGTGTVTIVPSNVLPTADSQSVSVDEDGSVNITLTATDPDNEPLTYSVIGGPTFGNLSGTAPNLTYTPNANFAGVDSFTFIASDCVGDSNVATITITVNPVNDPPSLEDIAPLTVDELTLATFLANAADPDLGDILTFTLIGAPAGASIHPTAGTFNWTPTEAQGPGVYTFDVQVTDSGSLSATKSVTITVNEVNVAPELTVDTSHTVDEGQLLTFSASAVDTDDPANTLTYSLVGEPSGMTINPTTGEVTWTPTEAQGPNSYTFTVKVTDDGTPNLSDEESVTVVVAEVNEAAVAEDQTVNTNEDDDVDITLVATDTDLPANTLDYIIVDAPLNGSLSGTAPNLTYTPNANWSGTDTFTFKVNDGTSDSNIATVTINVASINDAPVAGAPGDASVSQGQNLNLNLSAADVDADPFDVKVSLSVSNGKLTLASVAGLSFLLGDGNMDMAMEFTGSLADVNAALTGLLYKHTPGYNGTDTLVYTLNDLGNSGAGGPLSDTKNVLIDIVPAGAQIFYSSGYIVHAGEEFTGGLSTLLASDDDRLSIFNDPVTLAAAAEFYATSPINCPLELRFRMEHSASRPGLAYFMQLFNYDTNAWDVNVGDSETLTDTSLEVILTNGGALAHVNGVTGETRARIEWAPINDEDPAQDGWLHNVDLVRWRATP
ncbi:MAG TPA: Ig-like domain-containing protein [Fimbriimonadaceae bacterium]|nr:Ig-like domain-containing protein [Fimbriimonadaceae bacterium]